MNYRWLGVRHISKSYPSTPYTITGRNQRQLWGHFFLRIHVHVHCIQKFVKNTRNNIKWSTITKWWNQHQLWPLLQRVLMQIYVQNKQRNHHKSHSLSPIATSQWSTQSTTTRHCNTKPKCFTKCSQTVLSEWLFNPPKSATLVSTITSSVDKIYYFLWNVF